MKRREQKRRAHVRCTVTQTVANAAYPFIYGKVAFTFGACEATGNDDVLGAEWNCPGHAPCHDDYTLCGAIGCVCRDGLRTFVGFDHEKVHARNLNHPDENASDKLIRHCLGVVWKSGGGTNLFSLLEEHYAPYKNDLRFTSDNLAVDDDGKLAFGDKPKDMNPDICLIKLFYKSTQEFDKLWMVVNSPDTQTEFDNWYAQNSDISWTTNLPPPFASITIAVSSGTTNAVDPEPEIPNLWGTPHSINSYLHHDAKYEIRSNPVAGGHGHQATYDKTGALIENPIAAGTADLFAPYKANGKRPTVHSKTARFTHRKTMT